VKSFADSVFYVTGLLAWACAACFALMLTWIFLVGLWRIVAKDGVWATVKRAWDKGIEVDSHERPSP